MENEFLCHLLFASNLGFRVEDIPMNFQQALVYLFAAVPTEQHQLLCNLIWCIWKGMNEEIFEGKRFNPIRALHQARAFGISQKGTAGEAATVQGGGHI
jgi:hypothetical protein